MVVEHPIAPSNEAEHVSDIQPTRNSRLTRRVAFALAVVCAVFVLFLGVTLLLANREREHSQRLRFAGAIHVMVNPDQGPDDVVALKRAGGRALESGNLLFTQLDERRWRIVFSQMPITDPAMVNSLPDRSPKIFCEVSGRRK